jgi:hypothetical protein
MGGECEGAPIPAPNINRQPRPFSSTSETLAAATAVMAKGSGKPAGSPEYLQLILLPSKQMPISVQLSVAAMSGQPKQLFRGGITQEQSPCATKDYPPAGR